MTASPKRSLFKRPRLSSVLGLTLDGSRLEGVVLQRAGSVLAVRASFSVLLSLDPLTAAPELVGQELRNHLEAAGVRERHCILGLPLKWALTTALEVPAAAAESDLGGFLDLEAERTFPCDVATLFVATSLSRGAGADRHALMVGVPRTQLTAIDTVLRAARLKPVSFSVGISGLQPPVEGAEGVLALAVGETNVALQITSGGGVAALRMLEGALEVEGGQRVLHADQVAREIRITLSQLPAVTRETIRRVRVFGPRDLSQQLADELDLRFEALGLSVERVERYSAGEFGLSVPPDTAVSPAFSLAAGCLAGRAPAFELMPPRVSAFQQMAARYSSGKTRHTLIAVGSAAALVGALFFYQQVRLWGAEGDIAKLGKTVKDLNDLQGQIRQYRDWYDTTFAAMSVLKAMSLGFPENPEVTAKTVEIRDLHTVVCTGTARSQQALLDTVRRLRDTKEIQDVSVISTRGQAPSVQFTFTFNWNEGGSGAN